MKKSLSLLVAIAMVVSMFATVVSAADKTAGEKLKDLGIITGTSEGLQEDAEWLRKDVTILLSRLYGTEAEAKATANTHGFADLDAKGYNGYVSWAKTKGLFLGATETTFAPNDSITNYQFATVILRVLGQEQDKYEDNLAKAIELKVLPEGTVGTEKAKRGGIYTALVAALDVEVDGEKLGTKLKLKGYEIVDLAVKSASAVVAKTVVVDFNADVAAIASTDVSVKDADGNSVLVEKVEVNATKATVSLATALTSGKTYTVTIAKATGVKAKALENGSATFTYNKAVPASVAFDSTTVAKNTYVKYVVKDANGVDVTSDFPVSAFKVTSTINNTIGDGNNGTSKLYANATGYSVVNIELTADTKVTTGNVTIIVVNSLSTELKDVKTQQENDTLFLGELNGSTGYIQKTLVNKSSNDTAITSGVDYKYVSSNPAVLVVNDQGQYWGIQEGSSTVTVSATYEGKTVTKSIVVTVKKAREATSFSLDKSGVTVVKGVNIAQTVTVTVNDQYGNAYNNAVVTATVKDGGAVVSTSAPVKGQTKIQVLPANATGTSTIEVTVKEGNRTVGSTQQFTVQTVDKATESGYEVVATATTLDSRPAGSGEGKDANALNATVNVYVKDVNGNRVAVEPNFTLVNSTKNGKVTLAGAVVTPVQDAIGSDTVNIVINGVVVGQITFEVAPTSTKFASSVSVVKSAVTVAKNTNLSSVLFGNDGALKATNPYESQFAVNDALNKSISIYSSNSQVVNASGASASTQNVTGTAILTIVVNGSVFNITVNVE